MRQVFIILSLLFFINSSFAQLNNLIDGKLQVAGFQNILDDIQALQDDLADFSVNGKYIDSATSVANFPVIDATGKPVRGGDWVLLTVDDGSNLAGIYVWTGSSYLFTMRIITDPAPVLNIETNGNTTGVSQTGFSDHDIDITTISTDVNNSIKEGTDGGNYLASSLSARISNANTTLNLAATTGFVGRNLGVTDYNNFTTEVTPIANGFAINEAGVYIVTLNAIITSTGTRATTLYRFASDGTFYDLGYTYVRNAQNINELSISGTAIIFVSSSQNVTFQTRREGNIAAAVNPDAIGSVKMTITKL